MASASTVLSGARKTPVQARSTASVEAILEATVQVLLEIGKERLTTTRVAHRAGVSVGTLYQYFPDKQALLASCLKRHLSGVAEAVEAVCERERGVSLARMGEELVRAFLDAKLRSVETSAAMYAVSEDMDAAKIVQDATGRVNRAIAGMLKTAPEGLTVDCELAAMMLRSALAGVSRRMLEPGTSATLIAGLRQQMTVVTMAYLEAVRAG